MTTILPRKLPSFCPISVVFMREKKEKDPISGFIVDVKMHELVEQYLYSSVLFIS